MDGARRIFSTAVLAVLILGCRPSQSPERHPSSSDAEAAVSSAANRRQVEFKDVAAEAGLNFHHFTGATGDFHFAEITGSGLALIDYDNDGDLDVYLLQGALTNDEKGFDDCLFPPRVPLPPRNRLYRNELIRKGENSGKLAFVDVTQESGTGDTSYSIAVSTGDYDNDGFVDMYVSNFGPDILYRNNQDGTFSDVTRTAGLGDDRFTCSSVFFDADNDGALDLYVTGYCRFSFAINRECSRKSFGRDYCGPETFPPIADRLYRNRGDGTFEDISERFVRTENYGHGLAVVALDFDGNDLLDLYVANDGDANHLWVNADGRFYDDALLKGVAYNGVGRAEASMGIALGDYDDDGDPDLFLTHLNSESNTLYEYRDGGLFSDVVNVRGLASSSLPFTSFGVGWLDVDHDADLDLFVANGEVRRIHALGSDPYPYHQPNQLFVNLGSGRFEDRSSESGPGFTPSEVSRGAAFGDIDNDGDIDIVISNNNGPARLLLNDLNDNHHWFILRVIDRRTKRDAYNATVKARLSDGRTLTRFVGTAGSYASASDPRIHFAWPTGVDLVEITVKHVGGKVLSHRPIEINRIVTVRVGKDDLHWE